MSGHESDDERLAAFLDGRMDARRREEMLAHLARSAEDRAVLAGAAAILRELEEADAGAAGDPGAGAAGDPPEIVARPDEAETAESPTDVISLDARRASRPGSGGDIRQGRPRLLRWFALAAVVAALALAGRALFTRGSVGDDPVRLAARLEHGAQGLPAGWTDTRPWSLDRGGGGAPSAAERLARSVQAGAMLVDLSVAVRAADSAATHVLARQIAARFDPRGGALRAIADGAGGSPERLQPLVGEATERITQRLDPDALRLGAWTEAAGLAAASRDAAFFRAGETRRMLDLAARLTADDPAAEAAVRQVRALLAESPPRWDALASAVDALAGEITTE